MLDKMHQLEGIVARMQDALGAQNYAIRDVQDQVSEINKELGKMHLSSDNSTKFTFKADLRPIKERPSKERLHKSSMSRRSNSTISVDSNSSEFKTVLSPMLPKPQKLEEEEEEEDENYKRISCMLETLLKDAQSAVDYSPMSSSVFFDAQEEIPPVTAADSAPILGEALLCDEPVNVKSLTSSEITVSEGASREAELLDQALYDLEKSANHLPDVSGEELPDPTVITGEAVEVRFYCQVTRGGERPVRHELRRKLVFPSLTSNSAAFLKRLLLPAPTDSSALTIKSSTSPSSYTIAARAVGTVQVLYWMLLMTIGALLLDAYLCELASKEVIKVVACMNPPEEISRRRFKQITASPSTLALADGATEDERVDLDNHLEEVRGPRRRRRNRRNSM